MYVTSWYPDDGTVLEGYRKLEETGPSIGWGLQLFHALCPISVSWSAEMGASSGLTCPQPFLPPTRDHIISNCKPEQTSLSSLVSNKMYPIQYRPLPSCKSNPSTQCASPALLFTVRTWVDLPASSCSSPIHWYACLPFLLEESDVTVATYC